MVYFEQVNVKWEVYYKKRPRKPEKYCETSFYIEPKNTKRIS